MSGRDIHSMRRSFGEITDQTLVEILSSFVGSVDINFRLMRQLFGVSALQFYPYRGSSLYMEDISGEIPLAITLDPVIGGRTLKSNFPRLGVKKYCYENIKFMVLEKILNSMSQTNLCLLDIGANIGLFARQCAVSFQNIKRAYLYEPHPRNFDLLVRNLEKWEINPRFINCGLSNKSGKFTFYEDNDNMGNHSFLEQGMPKTYNEISVTCLNVEDLESEWLAAGYPLFYKSDTQGLDETIATSLSMSFWREVKVATLEPNIGGNNDFDIDKFYAIVDSFPCKVLETNPTKYASMSEIKEYIRGDKGGWAGDIILWR